MNNDRPDDWLGGYGPGAAPSRLAEGPNSPKKKTMSWKTSQGMQSLKGPPGLDDDGKEMPIGMINLGGNEDSADIDGTEYEEEEIIEVEEYSDSGYDDTSYEDPQEEVVEGSVSSEEVEVEVAEDNSDSSFEALSPPIDIPNALKPVHLREDKPECKPTKFYDSSDSDDSDDDDDSEVESVKRQASRPAPVMEKMKEAAQPIVKRTSRPGSQREAALVSDSGSDTDDEPPIQTSMRPGATRGHSFEEKPPQKKEPVFTRPIEESNDHSLRPAVERGHSFEEKPEPKKPLFSRPIEKSVDHSMRPKATRGHSFEEKPPPKKWTPTPASATAKADDAPEVDEFGRPKIEWKKPDWAKKTLLKQTSKAGVIHSGGNLAKPITNLPHMNPKGNFDKPDWTDEPALRETSKGEKLKQGEAISRPIGGIKALED